VQKMLTKRNHKLLDYDRISHENPDNRPSCDAQKAPG
jgi:hypothetical protein